MLTDGVSLSFLLALVTAYLVGSIPFGVIISRLFRVPDPRHTGSRNIGFTNVLRTSGKKTVGILTLLGDVGKGWLITWGAKYLFGEPWTLVLACSVVLGHIFSVFLRFHGGKGVATGLGSILGLDPFWGSLLIAIWLAVVGISRYSSAGALAAFGLFPILAVVFWPSLDFVIFAWVLSGVIWWRHQENLRRLMHGTERRIGENIS
ncbi:MAG: glycerol-3-phosphate 1-O-acyltransferase [Nitrospirae bacterium]|nr:MAG: glycerol-3-phosphate 1-O-acyltransferase [Nitrospirota bacterium]